MHVPMREKPKKKKEKEKGTIVLLVNVQNVAWGCSMSVLGKIETQETTDIYLSMSLTVMALIKVRLRLFYFLFPTSSLYSLLSSICKDKVFWGCDYIAFTEIANNCEKIRSIQL